MAEKKTETKNDYRATLNLPDTPFPMRGPGEARAGLGRGVAGTRAVPEDPQGLEGTAPILLHDGLPTRTATSTSATR